MKRNNLSIDDFLSEDLKKIKKTKPVGAPKKEIKRDKKIMVNLTKAELELVEKKANKLDISKASFARLAVLKYPL